MSMGMWTDDLVNAYRIHEIVHKVSTVFHEPDVLAQIVENQGTKALPYVPAELLFSDSNEYSVNKQLHFENRKKFLKLIRQQIDYGLALYGTVAPRATILQLFPYVSVLSIFASMTSADPIFLCRSPILEKNLKARVEKFPIEHNKIIAQEKSDFLWNLKQEETTENAYDLEMITEVNGVNDVNDVDDVNDVNDVTATNNIIKKKNATSAHRQKEVLEEGAQIVSELNQNPVEMLGHITSSYFSPNLGKSIALAVVKGGKNMMGKKLFIPMEDKTINVTVVDPIFLDKENERLNA